MNGQSHLVGLPAGWVTFEQFRLAGRLFRSVVKRVFEHGHLGFFEFAMPIFIEVAFSNTLGFVPRCVGESVNVFDDGDRLLAKVHLSSSGVSEALFDGKLCDRTEIPLLSPAHTGVPPRPGAKAGDTFTRHSYVPIHIKS